MKKTYMYQIAQQSHTQMMSYLIVSRDGSISIIDGGTKSDADYLLNLIEKVSGCKKPHISAWFLTHAHSDHINAFLEMFRNKSTYFSIDRIYHHFLTAFYKENERILSYLKILLSYYQHFKIKLQLLKRRYSNGR